VTGWGAEKQAVEGNGSHGGHGYVCEGDTALFRGEEGEPLNGGDQTSCLKQLYTRLKFTTPK
jgi:hypothetical protein